MTMTLAEETAALTGAKLTMPTRTLLQGKPYFPNHNILRSSNDRPVESNRERVQSGAQAVPPSPHPAKEGQPARSAGPVLRRAA
jgi:hypothetical protein